MKPTTFKHQNIVFAKDQKRVSAASGIKTRDTRMSCNIVLELTGWEQVNILFTGRMWLNLLSFNNPLTPSLLSVNRKDMYSIPGDSVKWYKRIFKGNANRL